MASTAAVQDGWMARAAAFGRLGGKVVPRRVCVRGAGRGHRRAGRDGLRLDPQATASAFGDGFWSLIPFTMQMAFVVIGGYAVATAGGRALHRLPGPGAAYRPRCGGAWAWSACSPRCSAGVLAGVRWPAGALRWPVVPNCAWTTAPPVLRRTSAWVRCGQWGSVPRPHSCRPTRPACRRGWWRSPACCVHRNHLPVAVDRADLGADPGLAADRLADGTRGG